MSPPRDPPRLSASTESSELGQLIASAARDLPSEAELARLAKRLGPVLDLPPAAPPAPRGYSPLVKLGVATGLAALIAAGVLASRRRSAAHLIQSPPASVSSRASASSVAAPEAVLTPAPIAMLAPADGAAPLTGSPKASPLTRKQAQDSVKSGISTAVGPSEPALLEHARRVLGSDPAAALALTNQHAVLFPHGVLVQEREVIAIEALRRLKRTAEADRRAAAFGQAFPGSVHQRRVEDAPAK